MVPLQHYYIIPLLSPLKYHSISVLFNSRWPFGLGVLCLLSLCLSQLITVVIDRWRQRRKHSPPQEPAPRSRQLLFYSLTFRWNKSDFSPEVTSRIGPWLMLSECRAGRCSEGGWGAGHCLTGLKQGIWVWHIILTHRVRPPNNMVTWWFHRLLWRFVVVCLFLILNETTI